MLDSPPTLNPLPLPLPLLPETPTFSRRKSSQQFNSNSNTNSNTSSTIPTLPTPSPRRTSFKPLAPRGPAVLVGGPRDRRVQLKSILKVPALVFIVGVVLLIWMLFVPANPKSISTPSTPKRKSFSPGGKNPAGGVRVAKQAAGGGSGGAPPSKLRKLLKPATGFFKGAGVGESSPFRPSSDPKPVHHTLALMDFTNHPVSKHRPSTNQFELDLSTSSSSSTPVVAIITASRNPRPLFSETITSVLGQSLQNFVWVIVDDHSSQADSVKLLAGLEKLDRRIKVLKAGAGQRGLASSRNTGLEYIFKAYAGRIPKYLVSLDDDDIFELTALEKSTWMLESNPGWSLAGFRVVKFGASNEYVTKGFHSGHANWAEGNFVPNAAIYSSAAVLDSGCRYDVENFKEGGEDWDFWMCLAEKGYWGGTVPEPLLWYRVNDVKFRTAQWGQTFTDSGFLALRRKIHDKHPLLASSTAFPVLYPNHSRQLEPMTFSPPWESHLRPSEKSILFILPWLYVGGADIGALHMIQIYAEQGYRVTVVCTLYKPPDGVELVPQVLEWTHDVHVLPSFLRAKDFPRYLVHLVRSRGVEKVIMSNSQLGYEMLPALTEQLPEVQFIDYLHNEAYDGWKSGGYPTYSIISQRHLSRTLTCSAYLKAWLLSHGHQSPSRIGVVKLGIEMDKFTPATLAERNAAKLALLNVPPSTVVITIVARIDGQKRPLLVPKIVLELIYRDATDFIVIMIGDGDLRPTLEEEIKKSGLTDFIYLEGTSERPQDFLEATDIFLLPSMSEGISIAVAEAMAMGLPVVTARAGALPEQLTDENGSTMAGVLVDHTLDDKVDAGLYADELVQLMADRKLRVKLGEQARRIVEKGFEWRKTLAKMKGEVALSVQPGMASGEENGERLKDLPHPAMYYSLQMLLLETAETDFSRSYWLGQQPNTG